jgi:hypothetical protein
VKVIVRMEGRKVGRIEQKKGKAWESRRKKEK